MERITSSLGRFLLSKIEVSFTETFAEDFSSQKEALISSWVKTKETHGEWRAELWFTEVFLSYFPEREKLSRHLSFMTEFRQQEIK